MLGDSGTGKTHLLIGLGLAACEQGRRVRYVTAAQLVNEFVEAADNPVLSRIVGRYGRLDLLLLDELGYVLLTPAEGSCFSRSSPNEKNRASRWDRTFRSPSRVQCSPIHAWSPPSSTASPTTPTSSKPAPSPTDSASARPPAAAGGPARTPRARDDMPARRCAECGQRLPRPFPGPGRLQQYCTPACRQKAYRRRGGHASGTTGAHRRRQQRANPPSDHQPNPGAKIHDDRRGQIT